MNTGRAEENKCPASHLQPVQPGWTGNSMDKYSAPEWGSHTHTGRQTNMHAYHMSWLQATLQPQSKWSVAAVHCFLELTFVVSFNDNFNRLLTKIVKNIL